MTPGQFTIRLLQETPNADAHPSLDNPLEPEFQRAGWELTHTGGGCTAFVKGDQKGTHLFLTDDAEAPVSMDQICSLFVHNGTDFLCAFHSISAQHALDLGDKFSNLVS